MIAQLLNRDFIIGAAEDTRLALKQIADKRSRREPVDAGPLEEISDAQEVYLSL